MQTKFKGTFALKQHVKSTRLLIETKESYRWLENLCQSVAPEARSVFGPVRHDQDVALYRQAETIQFPDPHLHHALDVDLPPNR